MARAFLGIDVQEQGLTFAALGKGKPASRLLGLRFESLPGTIELSSRQPNVRDTRRFIEGLRRGATLLAGREERVALSLPDRVGRLFMIEVDAPFKSRQEGVDVLTWRLKSSLPLPPAQMHIDYQVLDRREDSRQRCLVAAIGLPILDQYQDLVNEAGRHAVNIDFH
ncbi:MAG: pilus assembly protein PilM, partial [Desulfuromonas sp.]